MGQTPASITDEAIDRAVQRRLAEAIPVIAASVLRDLQRRQQRRPF